MTTAKTSTLLLSIVLLTIPGLFLLEKTTNNTWNSRLLFPSFQKQVNLHTPYYTDGTYLPTTITKNQTLTPANNPVIITGVTTIAPNTTLTVEPSTNIYALEHANFTINGTLNLKGTANQPIKITSNESNPTNRSWAGLITSNTGTLNATHTTIAYAYPAISCAPTARANLNHLTITNTNLGFYTESPTCTLTNSRLQARRTGILSTIPTPPLSQLTIQAPQDIKQINP